MRLHELRLTNFRQFYGEQTLHFAAGDEQKNVTVIHGFNGSGKTALLNAFVWCLYGETTPDLDFPDKLANETALADAGEQPVIVGARLKFTAMGETYFAERKQTVAQGGRASKSTFTLMKIGADGEAHHEGGADASEATAQLRIGQLLPPDLYHFFFFNGERVERLASPDAYERVEGGVKTLLNIEIFERSAKHLRSWVSSELSKELREFGDADMLDAVQNEERLRGEIEAIQTKMSEATEAVAKCETEIERIERKQSEIAELADLAAQRAEKRAHLSDVQRENGALREELARSLSRNGYLAFGEAVLTAATNQISEARKRGDLPAKVKPQFVDDLILRGDCVCGRPIGDAEVAHLKEWRKTTGLAGLEEAISQVGGQVPNLRSRRDDFLEEVGRLLKRRSELFSLRRTLSDELDVLNSKIGDESREDAAALEQQRQRIVRESEETRLSLRLLREELESKQALLDAELTRIQKLKSENEKVKLVQRRKEAVDRVAAALDRICEIQKQDVRRDLSNQVARIWTDAAVKDYEASVDENFRLVLEKTVGGIAQPVHGASTGEKQVLALSFVGSLVQKAKENAAAAEGEGLSGGLVVGGEYPLVMDSPFGSLEEDYQKKVAEWVPRLAGQVVVMASKSQWTDQVESALRERIGREFVLELHTPKVDAERTIEIAGKSYPYVRHSSGAVEQTKIEEVA